MTGEFVDLMRALHLTLAPADKTAVMNRYAVAQRERVELQKSEKN